jgi:hypothetical protein
LVKVCRFVFDNFDGHDFMGLHILTFDHLSEGALAENIENEIPGGRGRSECKSGCGKG